MYGKQPKNWFENYLCNRKQLIKYNGVESEEDYRKRCSIGSFIVSVIYK